MDKLPPFVYNNFIKERFIFEGGICQMPIIGEGYPFIGGCLVLAVVLGFSLHPVVAVVPMVLALYFCYFFRNPKRKIIRNENVVLSPADGTVTEISDIDDDEFVEGACHKVVIFMSVFNVHVNRSPIDGEIKVQKYYCGRFRPAYKDAVGFVNEHHLLGIANDRIKITVKQIAGILARRIVSYVTLDDKLAQGQLYGMIKFGSCLEVVMPKDVALTVKVGEKVAGGKTIIGRLED